MFISFVLHNQFIIQASEVVKTKTFSPGLIIWIQNLKSSLSDSKATKSYCFVVFIFKESLKCLLARFNVQSFKKTWFTNQSTFISNRL